LILFLIILLLLLVFSIINNWFLFFIVLEGLSLVFYVLLSSGVTASSTESSIKYFLINNIFGIFFLFGLLFLFTGTNTMNMDEMIITIYHLKNFKYIKLGALLILLTFLAKLGGVPYHFYIPEVYLAA